MAKRNWAQEYKKYGGRKKAIKDRAATNYIRNLLKKPPKDRPAGFKHFQQLRTGDNKNVNHKDGDQQNNSPSNIEIVSESENKADVKGKRRRANGSKD